MRNLAVVVVVLCGVGYAVVHFTLDVTPDTLGRSLAGETRLPRYQRCRGGGAAWSCRVLSERGALARYRVTATGDRCWRARRVAAGRLLRHRAPLSARGCVDAWEQISNFEPLGNEPYD